MSMWKYKNALKLALDYIESPYNLLEPTIYSEDSHEHICFARRLMGKNFKDVCPDYYTDEFDYYGPERLDCCEMCPYFGIISFCEDETGEQSIKFYMNKSIVDTFEDENNEY